jgi:hypothetical protein
MAIIYNGVNVAQDPLVSGTNIKTVNGTSLLGSGNIVAGGSSTDYGAIGTYVMAGSSSWNIAIPFNTTVAGSTLVRHNTSTPSYAIASSNTNAYGEARWTSSTGVASCGLTGTWRSVTACTAGSSFSYAGITTYTGLVNIYVRIS